MSFGGGKKLQVFMFPLKTNPIVRYFIFWAVERIIIGPSGTNHAQRKSVFSRKGCDRMNILVITLVRSLVLQKCRIFFALIERMHK